MRKYRFFIRNIKKKFVVSIIRETKYLVTLYISVNIEVFLVAAPLQGLETHSIVED